MNSQRRKSSFTARREKGATADATEKDNGERGERLQKVMAAAGVGSRRQCEELIAEGRVEIDGEVVTQPGTRVGEEQEIRVDGSPIRQGRRAYYLVNKPPGVISTNNDPSGRPRVIDMLPPSGDRLFTVGRLDMFSEGLILVTNDGDLANRLTHPRYGVEKVYHAVVAGTPEKEVLDKLRSGVHLAEGIARVESVKVKSQQRQSATLEIVLKEGKNREIRRILARVGHKVLKLKRVAIGGIKLADLPVGEFRPLRKDEVRRLHESAEGKPHARQASKVKRAKPLKATGRRPQGKIIGGAR